MNIKALWGGLKMKWFLIATMFLVFSANAQTGHLQGITLKNFYIVESAPLNKAALQTAKEQAEKELADVYLKLLSLNDEPMIEVFYDGTDWNFGYWNLDISEWKDDVDKISNLTMSPTFANEWLVERNKILVKYGISKEEYNRLVSVYANFKVLIQKQREIIRRLNQLEKMGQ